MDFRKYEVFLRTLECGSLTRAGEELGYTQSGVSHMMKSLEEEVGFRLFSRGRAGMELLTSEGARIVPIIRELSKWNEQLSQVLSSIKGFELGTIRIAAMASISFLAAENNRADSLKTTPTLTSTSWAGQKR